MLFLISPIPKDCQILKPPALKYLKLTNYLEFFTKGKVLVNSKGDTSQTDSGGILPWGLNPLASVQENLAKERPQWENGTK